MKKLITTTLIILMLAISFVSVIAQEGEMRSINEIVLDIRADLGLSTDAVIDPALVDAARLEELGDSVMEAYFNNTELHEEWDEYLGGENSETLENVHIQLGVDYLKGYPITMMSFMPFDTTRSFDSNRGFGMMGGFNQSNYGYDGMMGGYNQSNFGYRGMMGNWFGQNSISSQSAPNITYGSYGMMNTFGFGGMFIGMFGFVLVIVLIVLVISRLFNRQQTSVYSDNALDILKVRYARGEIDREEYIRSSNLIR